MSSLAYQRMNSYSKYENLHREITISTRISHKTKTKLLADLQIMGPRFTGEIRKKFKEAIKCHNPEL